MWKVRFTGAGRGMRADLRSAGLAQPLRRTDGAGEWPRESDQIPRDPAVGRFVGYGPLMEWRFSRTSPWAKFFGRSISHIPADLPKIVSGVDVGGIDRTCAPCRSRSRRFGRVPPSRSRATVSIAAGQGLGRMVRVTEGHGSGDGGVPVR